MQQIKARAYIIILHKPLQGELIWNSKSSFKLYNSLNLRYSEEANNPNWKKLLVFRNMQEKLEREICDFSM